jgi:hypothetical protein
MSFLSDFTLKVIAAIGVLTFLTFFAVSFLIGGEAGNGWIENGRYFLRGHGGEPVEVTAALFTFSRVHAFAVLLTFPPALLAWYVLNLRWKRR